MPPCERMQNDVSVDHSQGACGQIFHSRVHQPVECFSLPTHSFSEISKILTGAVGKALASPLHPLMDGAEDLKDTLKYTHYGIGMGEKVEPQPPIHHKTEVFVSPTAPPSPPPLPPDWLALLRQPKKADAPAAIHFPSRSASTVLRNPAASHPQCLQSTSETSVPIPPTNVDLSPPVPKFVQYGEMLPHDMLPPDEEKGQCPTMSPPPVRSHRIERKDTVTDGVGHAPVIQSLASVVFPSSRSTCAQSPKHSVTKLPRSSVLSTPRSSLSPPSRYPIPLAKSSTAPLSGHSTLKNLHKVQLHCHYLQVHKHQDLQFHQESIHVPSHQGIQLPNQEVYMYRQQDLQLLHQEDLQLHNQQDI
ncbi:wiskott-Aldrich syndrome protein family member 1-like [Heterocephalus glaber]|uniref:Wiskott-Aldrich syndrome protein family member 1-like n=1 Tax=Heterocephalus glaber TaxID=10181 RepID=A0AAX6SFP5_HETGA|nr:wiskott-Aldrich syndrome protein family member 1-like [Heterocephalus glaber]